MSACKPCVNWFDCCCAVDGKLVPDAIHAMFPHAGDACPAYEREPGADDESEEAGDE